MIRQFREVSEDAVKKIINGMAIKWCENDPIPTSLLKQILPAVISTIMKIINMSLRDEIFASNWKTAIVRSLLKKTGTPFGTQQFQACVKLALLGKGP